MSNKALKQFVQLRSKLVAEKVALEARLQAINEALDIPSPSQDSGRTATKGKPGRKPGGRRSPMSLKVAVAKVTASKPLTREEIVEAVQKIGYRFTGKSPIASLGAVLYGNKSAFKNVGGKFQPA